MEAKIWNQNFWVEITDPMEIMKIFGKMLKKSGFTILHICAQRFEPQGFTAVWILAESHLAIHTFPEENKTYVELSSCNRDKFASFIAEMIKNF